MKTDQYPRHFLNKRAKELFERYNKLGDKRCPEEHERLMRNLWHVCEIAFHTDKTLKDRKFYHCPTSDIPYHSCVIKRPRI